MTSADQLRQQASSALAGELTRDPLFAPHADLCWTLEEEVGRGGMGSVYRVQDRALGRVAALKVLHSEKPRRVARFLREARVTAGLAHPGIPPVYEAGRNTEGQHYLLMRMIEGQTLAERIRRLHSRKWAAEAELRELLHALVRVAEAVAYAHAQQVVHRDLKPENVMVGMFGEVLVMDWGLAKVHGESEIPGSAGSSSGSSAGSTGSDSRLTMDGAVLGTPGYIAPELLQGMPVDGRADVFALGAILGTILTGHGPFPGPSTHAILARNAACDAVFPSDVDASIPGPLDAITRRALASSPQARFPSAMAFANELRGYLAGDEVASHHYGVVERLRRFATRHAPLLVAMLLLTAAGLGLWLARGRVASAGAAAAQSELAAEARAAAEGARANYESTAGTVSVRTAMALSAFEAAQQWYALAQDADSAPFLLDAAMALAEVAAGGEQWGLALAACDEAQQLGLESERVEQLKATIEERRSAESRLREQELSFVIDQAEAGHLAGEAERVEDSVLALMRYPDAATAARLAQVLNLISVDLESAEREVWLSAATPTPEEANAGELPIPELAQAYDAWIGLPASDWPPVVRETYGLARQRLFSRASRGKGQGADSDLVQARVLAYVVAAQERALVTPGWQDLSRVCCEALGQIGVREAKVASALGRYLSADAGPNRAAAAAQALCLLGGPEARDMVMRGLGRFGTRGAFSRAVTPWLVFLEQEVQELSGESVQELMNRAELKSRQGELEGALADLTRAIELEPTRGVAYGDRGVLRRELGQLEDALEDFASAIEREPEVANHWNNRALVREDQGDLKGAEADYGRALELAPRMPEIWNNRGATRRSLRDWDGAIADLTRALELEPTMGAAYVNRGIVHFMKGDAETALPDCDRGVELLPGAAAAWSNRAMVRLHLKQLNGSWEDAARALELNPKQASAWFSRGWVRHLRGDDVGALEDLTRGRSFNANDARGLKFRGEVLVGLGRFEEALEDLDAVAKRAPSDVVVRYLSGLARGGLGDFRGAVLDAEAFTKLNPASAIAWSMLGQYRLQLGQRDEAILALDRALELEPQRATALVNRGIARHEERDLEGALADLDLALRVDPKQAPGWLRRGMIRGARGDNEGALGDLARALDLDPNLTEAYAHQGLAHQRLGQLPEAIEAYDVGVTGGDRSGLRMQRGTCHLGLGDLERARSDFEAARSLLPPQAYAPLLLAGAGGPREALVEAAEGDDSWVAQIAEHMLGKLDAESLLAEAEVAREGVPDPSVKRCEAQAYLGLLAERAGKRDAAIEHYRAAAASGAKRSILELFLAEARLRALTAR